MDGEAIQYRFTRPPLDGSLTVPEMYDWNYVHNKDYPLFVYEDGPGHLRSLSMGEAVQGMHRATRFAREKFPKIACRDSEGNPPVIAILAASDTITFFCTIFGVLRTGATVFLLSPRNSAQAISFLLSTRSVMGILVSSESSIQQLASDSIKTCSQTGIQIVPMPTFETLFPSQGFDPHFDAVPSAKLEMDLPALIYHSSGTTSFPKPILWSHKALYWVAMIPVTGKSQLPGSTLAFHCAAMFHSMSALAMNIAPSVGVTLAVFKPQIPAIVPNPVNVLEGALATNADFLICPPSFIEHWAQIPEYVDATSSLKGILYAGAPLAKHAGDTLASKGLNIYQIYASTEAQLLSKFLPEKPGMDWDYFELNPERRIHLDPWGSNEFKVIIVASDNFIPTLVNTQVDGIDAHDTNDLVSPHPTKDGYFKVVGRADDQIMHSNGEKTNPGPLEEMLDQDPSIEKAMMFGRGRFQCGVLIQPSKTRSIDPSDESAIMEFRRMIWPTIQKVNAFAPTHSRIFKEMILVASPEKPFEYTPKRSLRRQLVLETYSGEIEALYEVVEESAQPDIGAPDDWTLESIFQLTQDVVKRTMKNDVDLFGEDGDLFEHGLDSLQATWIRNTFVRILRESDLKLAQKLSPNFVYEHPTISGIANYIYAVITENLSPKLGNKETELLALVKKYTNAFPDFTASAEKRNTGRVILLTGSTGSFGSNLLAKLLQDSTVDYVYSLSRPSPDAPVPERLQKAFEKEGLGRGLLKSKKLGILEGDPSKLDFGVGNEEFRKLLSTVTHVIHNGWRVNYRNAIGSFESNINSTRNFVDFCLRCESTSPARLIFISSIGVFKNRHDVEPEERLDIENVALGFGYGESKWVAEELLHEAAEKSASKITIIRPGQITGGPSGAWNEHEWFPSLVRSSVLLNKLPTMEGEVSWISAHVAAGALVDMLDSEERIVHLVHPRPVKFSEVISRFSKILRIPVVPYDEWLDTLEQTRKSTELDNFADVQAALEKNPALRLFGTFQSFLTHKDESFEPRLASEKAQKVSNTLRSATPLTEKNVRAWIAYWKKTGFLK